MRQIALWFLIFRWVWEIYNWFTILHPQASTQSSVLLINDHRDTINLASFRAFCDTLCFCLDRIWLVVNLDSKCLQHEQKSNIYFRLFEKIKVPVWSHMAGDIKAYCLAFCDTSCVFDKSCAIKNDQAYNYQSYQI